MACSTTGMSRVHTLSGQPRNGRIQTSWITATPRVRSLTQPTILCGRRPTRSLWWSQSRSWATSTVGPRWSSGSCGFAGGRAGADKGAGGWGQGWARQRGVRSHGFPHVHMCMYCDRHNVLVAAGGNARRGIPAIIVPMGKTLNGTLGRGGRPWQLRYEMVAFRSLSD